MSTFRPKLWTSVSAALILSAAGGLAACGGESAETANGEPEAAPAQAQASATVPTASTGGEGEGGEGEGEGGSAAAGGEAGAQDAYSNVSAESRTALRLAHLRGFLLAARAAAPAEGVESAAALVGQGMAEVYDPAAAEFKAAGVNEAALRKAAQSGSTADLNAALSTLNAASARAGGNPAEVVKGMTEIASGLYGEVNRDGAVDSVEYQHSLGAALSAQAAARQANATAAAPELDRFVKLWPSPTAPEDVSKLTPAGQVLAQASRVELALSR